MLLDVHLPDRTGIDVPPPLRAAGDDTGVVMVTAAREAETVRAAAAGGAAHYLVKPFEYDDLRARLEAFRAAHAALASGTRPAQDDIDAVFAPVVSTRPVVLPKGLSAPTADAVLEALGGAEELSAAEAADAVGISRVSRPALPRALRQPGPGRGATEVRRRRPPRAPLPPPPLTADLLLARRAVRSCVPKCVIP